MQSGFEKFKKKQRKITLINSVIWGVSLCLLSLGVLFMFEKLAKKEMHVLFYVFVPLISLFVGGLIAYFVFRKKDKKIAKDLDEKFALSDKVQTMLEFQKSESAMIRLQREDAKNCLDKIPLRQWKWKGLWSCLVALTCAIALFVTGLAIPKKQVYGDGDNGGGNTQTPIVFEITDMQKTKLATLIQNVKESKAEEPVKNEIVSRLEELQLTLDDIDTADQLYLELATVIVAVDDFVEGYNTYKRVYQQIRPSELIIAQQFAIGLGINALPYSFEDIKAYLQNAEEKTPESILSMISTFEGDIRERLSILEEKEDDALMLALDALLAQIKTTAALNPSNYTHDKILDAFMKDLNAHVKSITIALEQQFNNRTVTNDTIEELIKIFNMPMDKIPPWGGEALEGLGGADEVPDDDQEGGDDIIDDEDQYPSDEEIYDYYTKQICAYWEVFDGDVYNYKREVNMLIAEGIENGTISPEMEELLRSYFGALSGEELPKNDA